MLQASVFNIINEQGLFMARNDFVSVFTWMSLFRRLSGRRLRGGGEVG